MNVAPASIARRAASSDRTVPAPTSRPRPGATDRDGFDRVERVGFRFVERQLEGAHAAVGEGRRDVRAGRGRHAPPDRHDAAGRDPGRDLGSRRRRCHRWTSWPARSTGGESVVATTAPALRQ